MSKTALPTDLNNLPPRLPLPLVLELACYSRSTLRLRQRAGRMPYPIDRGGTGGIYDRDAVLKALGLAQDEKPEAVDPWTFNPDAYREALARQARTARSQRKR